MLKIYSNDIDRLSMNIQQAHDTGQYFDILSIIISDYCDSWIFLFSSTYNYSSFILTLGTKELFPWFLIPYSGTFLTI